MTQAEYDREKAFAYWYNKNGKGTPTYSDAIEWARRELIDKAVTDLVDSGVFGHKDSYGAKAFKQAMEEWPWTRLRQEEDQDLDVAGNL